MNGKVLAIIRPKGYGFLLDEAGVERFFHANNCRGNISYADLREGMAVTFEPVEAGSKANGQRAESVEKAA